MFSRVTHGSIKGTMFVVLCLAGAVTVSGFGGLDWGKFIDNFTYTKDTNSNNSQ